MTNIKIILWFSLFYGSKAGLIMNSTRRILQGTAVGETRPYMVYLRPAPAELADHDPNWLCGGVIIHERYVLTSAACIENVKHFYVISGTNKWLPPNEENDCIKHGKKKAIWKCEPSSYFYDGEEFDNIRWMSNDIAVVKTEDDFNFARKVKGCDYSPKKIAFNNITDEKEKAGSIASIAGWGTTERFGDLSGMLRTTENNNELLETEVKLISKKNCKKRWPERYHEIIDDCMICAKDGMDSEVMPAPCAGEVNCKGLIYSDEDIEDEEQQERRRFLKQNTPVLSASMNDSRRAKAVAGVIGGFCENDHGGPLVVGQGTTAMVIGVISASQTHEVSNKCFGPYLYSSVWKNRHLLTCAIDKEKWGGTLHTVTSTVCVDVTVCSGEGSGHLLGNFCVHSWPDPRITSEDALPNETCRRLLKSLRTQITETNFDWSAHPDGPAKQDNADIKAKEGSKTTKVVKSK